MTEKKYRLQFGNSNAQGSVSYILVSKFNIEPNILQAKLDGSGGRMILSMRGADKDIADAVAHLISIGISATPMDDYVKRDEKRCIDCGACISVCPTFAFEMDRETWDVTLDTNKCIACGFCLSACPTHAVSMKMNL